MEVDQKMGININENDKHKDISPEILSYFTKNKQPQVIKNNKEKTSNIVRFVTHFRNEIPEKYRDDFLEWIKTKDSENFIFDDCKFPLAEFGGNIIKGLYLWKPKEDTKLINSYKYFFTQFEECMLEKNHILSLDTNVEDKKVDEDGWSNAFDSIKFE